MSGEDEAFCKWLTLKQAMTMVLLITVWEMLFHLAVALPLTWLVYEENLVLFLGMMIPLCLLTVIRPILICHAIRNKLDFFAREKSYYFYILSTLVEWSILAVWTVKFYKTKFEECAIYDTVCTMDAGIPYFVFFCFLCAYVLLSVPVKIFNIYVQNRYYMA